MITLWKPKKPELFKVFVYCGGKCGSSTLERTFRNTGVKTIHIHSEINYNLVHSKYIKLPMFSLMNMSKLEEPIIVIDSYRLPVERKMSSFFQNLKVEKSIDELIVMFNNQFNTLESYHSINEVFDHYNIKRFTSFDFVKRFVIKKENNIIFVKLHFNDISNWGTILSNIWGRPITIISDNLSTNKHYHKLYTLFKKQYKLPKEFLDKIKEDVEFKIYNTPQEQEEYIQKWRENSV